MKTETGLEIDLKRVVFTAHALERFVERSLRLNPGGKLLDPEKTARKILARATEEGAISSVGRVRRLIDSHFQEARYFIKDGWRFVVKDNGNETFTVLTIERVIFKH